VTVTRAQLEQAAAAAEQAARTARDKEVRERNAWLASRYRQRLQQGDLQAGHRIMLFVVGDSALSDTFTVRADQKLLLPNLPDISLAGVLESELQDYLQKQLSKYLREPTVRAQALLRVAVLGEVGRPGFYSVPTDAPVSDVIMTAGGPNGAADMRKVVLRRGSEVAVSREGIQDAFRQDLTMSDVGARPGDELYIPSKDSSSRWATIAAVVGSVTGIIWTVIYIARQ
jgi:protein involved in polysaccharide export with SLBB domain